MSRHLPPLTWFRSFEAAARMLSFTAAAEEIGLTQSAVSQQVKSLELRLGVALFVRRPRGLALTDEGRKLLPQVEQALETLQVAAGSVNTAKTKHMLTVATSVSVAQWLIAPNIGRFQARVPNVRVRLLSAVWPDDFHASHADVQIRFGSFKQVGQGAILLKPDHLIAVKSPKLKGDAGRFALIETVGTSSGWRAWQSEYGNAGQQVLFSDTYGMALQLAANGHGVALVSALLTVNAIRDGHLEQAYPGALPSQEGYYLSVATDNPAAVEFGRWIQDLTA